MDGACDRHVSVFRFSLFFWNAVAEERKGSKKIKKKEKARLVRERSRAAMARRLWPKGTAACSQARQATDAGDAKTAPWRVRAYAPLPPLNAPADKNGRGLEHPRDLCAVAAPPEARGDQREPPRGRRGGGPPTDGRRAGPRRPLRTPLCARRQAAEDRRELTYKNLRPAGRISPNARPGRQASPVPAREG